MLQFMGLQRVGHDLATEQQQQRGIPLFLHCLKLLTYVPLFVTLWTVAYQAPLSMGFFRQEYWNGLTYLPPGDLPDPGIKPTSSMSPALQEDSLPLSHRGSPVLPQDLSCHKHYHPGFCVDIRSFQLCWVKT